MTEGGPRTCILINGPHESSPDITTFSSHAREYPNSLIICFWKLSLIQLKTKNSEEQITKKQFHRGPDQDSADISLSCSLFGSKGKCKLAGGIYGLHVLQTILHKYHFSPLGISGGLENRIQGFLYWQEPGGQKFSVSTKDKAIWFVNHPAEGRIKILFSSF